MSTRTLRRKVIIREYDYERVKRQAFAPLAMMGLTETLYDRSSFIPLDQDALEKLKLQEILKGKNTPLTESDLNLKIPALFLRQLKDYLYNDKYGLWHVTIDEDGYICVQARKNTPKSRIGWAVFEKDITSRL
jgi:hypothetical protein